MKTETIDYRQWIDRAARFTNELIGLAPYFAELNYQSGVQPPLTKDEFEKLRKQTDRFIPAELARFWQEATRFCDFSYRGESAKQPLASTFEIFGFGDSIYGGANFLNAVDLPRHLQDLRDWAEETWVAEYPRDKSFWLNSIPLISIQNGDYLALDLTERNDDPPVVYLSHDDESKLVAESLTDFLKHWERVCYIGPESWMLDAFLDERGYLNSASAQAEKLRDCFVRV